MADMAEPLISSHSKCSSSNYSEDQGQMVVDVIVDIEAILLNKEEPPLQTACCICRVPHVVRELSAEAYTPKIVSIGPFHYGNPRLQNMERHKQVFFKRFIERAEVSRDDLVSFVKSSEPRVRACYSENIKLSKNELVKLILVDIGFIIELFRLNHLQDWLQEDVILLKPWLHGFMVMDFLLLENQLPFFIFEEVFNQVFPPNNRSGLPSFLVLTFKFFSSLNKQNLEPDPSLAINHFTDLLRTFHLQRPKPRRQPIEGDGSHVISYSANELHEAGVKFIASTSNCLLDLKFSGGVLEIPRIFVEDNTDTMLRNMIALEQYHYPYETYIVDYVVLLDCLMNTSKDVDVLVHQGIIRSYLPDSNNVAKLYNSLGQNIAHIDLNSDYFDICKNLNGFYKDPCNNMKATLRRDYCNTPWQIVASIAGILIIILTIVQTIFTILQVV